MEGFETRDGNEDVQDGEYGVPHGKAARDDKVNYAGTTIHVTWGKEHIQPLRFQGLDIGPFAMDVVVLEGETPLQAKRRAMVHLNEMAEEEVNEKMPRFIERCQEAATDL